VRGLLVLAAIGAAITLLFADGALDLGTARLFYSAGGVEHWPLGGEMPWSLLYKMARRLEPQCAKKKRGPFGPRHIPRKASD
jgi:hypothetical protein